MRINKKEKNMFSLKIDEEKCVKCGLCISECPLDLIQGKKNEIPTTVEEAEESCLGCQHCYSVCPTGALSIFGLDPEKDSIKIKKENLPTGESMELLARSRRSIRKFKNENVPQEIIESILKVTANAPTAANSCGLKFDVINDREKINKLRNEIMAPLDAFKENKDLSEELALIDFPVELFKEDKIDPIFQGAPHALIISSQSDVKFSSIVDVVIAMSYFELIAQAHGIGTLWVGRMKMILEVLPEIKKKLITPGAGDYYCMVFGYPAVKFARTSVRDNSAAIRYI
jgi:ferredoxin